MPVETAIEKEIETEDSGATFEEKLGQVWLVRIGIVLLITGLVLGANWAYKNWIHDLPAGVRLAGLYLCSALIGGSGIWLSGKENFKHYGEVLLAGGLAFFTTAPTPPITSNACRSSRARWRPHSVC